MGFLSQYANFVLRPLFLVLLFPSTCETLSPRFTSCVTLGKLVNPYISVSISGNVNGNISNLIRLL